MSTATITGGKLELAGDGYGWASAVKTLPVAPATTKRMVFAWRGWFDTYNVGAGSSYLTTENSVVTDLQWLFGLNFSPIVPYQTGITGEDVGDSTQSDGGHFAAAFQTFFGQASYRSTMTNLRIQMQNYPHAEGEMAAPADYNSDNQYTGFFGANSTLTALDYEDQVSASGDKANLYWPANPTDGANFTGIWEVYGSDVDNSVWYRLHINWDAVSTNDLLLAYNQVGTLGASSSDTTPTQLHGDTTGTNWRNADGSMNFPRYLMLRYPYKAQKMVLDHYKIAYYDSV